MKKVLSLVLFAALLMCVACTASADYPKMSIGVASIFVDPNGNPNFNAEGLSQQYFADLVSERSGGQITVKNYWSGMLQGDYPTMLSDGELEMYYGYLNASVDKRVCVFNLPGLVTDLDMAWDLMGTDGPFFAKYKEIAAEYGITAISGTAGVMRQFYNNKRPVKTPADVSDMLVRAYNDVTVTNYWGGIANTVILPMSELYTSMQMGSLDAFEHGGASAISNNLQEVAKYCTVVNWQWQYMPSFFAGSEFYDSLSPDVAQLISECANEAAAKYYELAKEMETTAWQFLADNGVEVYFPTDDEKAEWAAYGASLYEKLGQELGCEELVKEVVQIADEYKAAHAK